MIELKNIHKSYQNKSSVNDVSLSIEKHSVFCLLGPSGCGKTTLLRIIAGLEQQDSGYILYHGKRIGHIPPHKRNFGFMFQDFALFPHKNVRENVEFGLLMKKKNPEEIRKTARRMLKIVGLEDFAEKDTQKLSGGEKQRVALARSLAPSPDLLMLDEPLGSLDRNLRDTLLADLKIILKKTGTTAIFVTHDQSEAFAIADTIAVMKEGRIIQADTPQRLYNHPNCEFIARFLGYKNILNVSMDHSNGLQPEKLQELPGIIKHAKLNKKDSFILIKPEGIRLVPEPLKPEGSDTVYPGTISSVTFKGRYLSVCVTLDCNINLSFDILAENNRINDGDKVYIHINPSCVLEL